METQGKSHSQGSGVAGTETTISAAEIDRILADLEPLYADGAQEVAEEALESLGRLLSTGNFSLEDVDILADLEEQMSEAPDRLESVRGEIAALRARL